MFKRLLFRTLLITFSSIVNPVHDGNGMPKRTDLQQAAKIVPGRTADWIRRADVWLIIIIYTDTHTHEIDEGRRVTLVQNLFFRFQISICLVVCGVDGVSLANEIETITTRIFFFFFSYKQHFNYTLTENGSFISDFSTKIIIIIVCCRFLYFTRSHETVTTGGDCGDRDRAVCPRDHRGVSIAVFGVSKM